MSQKANLVKRTAIYAVGNIGSKVFAYLMTLIYSYYIEPEDMGYYDIILTTVAMIQPLVLFQINDAVYRFLLDEENDRKELIFSTSISFVVWSVIITCSALLFVNLFYPLRFFIYIELYLLSFLFFAFIQDSIRGLSKSKLYAVSGLINSSITLIIEIIGLIFLHGGIEVLLLAKAVANFIGLIYIYLNVSELHNCRVTRFNKYILFDLIRYSAPLVPNTIGWWIVNSSDRYIILFFLGASYNGIYSMTNKFPTILSTLTSVFYLAWQESAIKEYNSPNRDIFFSEVFKKYYRLLFGITIIAIPFITLVIENLVAAEYSSSWKYVGFLFLGACYSALSSFLGLGYQISKETKRSMLSTLFAAFLNIVINVCMISSIGLHAASISTFVSYMVLFFIRIAHTKKYFTLSFNKLEFSFMTIINIAFIFILLINNSIAVVILQISVGVILFTLFNREIIDVAFNKLKRNTR